MLKGLSSTFSQVFLVGEASDHLGDPPMDLSNRSHIFLVVGASELAAALQVRSHRAGQKGKKSLALPAMLPWIHLRVHLAF